MFERAHNPNSSSDEEARIIPHGLTLPPPALLWEWLSYIYQTTGEWWRPPTLPDSTKTPVEPRIAPVVSVKGFQNRSRLAQLAVPLSKPTREAAVKPVSDRTGFDYQASAYYAAAGRLLEDFSGVHNSVESLAERRLVLSFIIAWSRFSLFRDLPLDGKEWMAFSFSRAASELKMRASRFKTCLDDLEAAGLLRPVIFSEGLLDFSTLAELQRRRAGLSGEAATLFNAHFLQKNTRLYLLPVALKTALPDFIPSWERLIGLGKSSEELSTAGAGLVSVAGSFQKAACNYESKNENENFSILDEANKTFPGEAGAIKSNFSSPENLNLVLQSLSSQQQSTYQFISDEARFEGYCRQSDGRETLDDSEALKFAAAGRLSLEQVITRYAQVKEVWESHVGCHNPLALFHWTLTNDIDPRRGKSKTSQPPTYKPAVSQPARRPYEAARARPQLSYQKRMFAPTHPAPASNTGEVFPAPESLKIFEPSDDLKEPEKLWKIVFEDLTGRLQLAPAKLALLQDATLHVNEDASVVEITLRSVWEERQLDASTRHLINLALRQRLGPGLAVSFGSK